MDTNVQYLTQLKTNLERSGHTISEKIGHYSEDYKSANAIEIIIICLGIFVMVFKLVHRYFPLNVKRIIFVILGLAVILDGAILTGNSDWVLPIMAVLAAIVFPTFAVISYFPYREGSVLPISMRWKQSLYYVLKVSGLSLVGAICIVGLLSGPEYLLGVVRFSGVKLSFIVPLFLIWTFFFLNPYRITSMAYVFKRISLRPVNILALSASVISILFIFLYILRSGNYVVFPTFGFEAVFRDLLEQNLLVRPRTKEFLIGYPILILASVFVGHGLSKNWIWFFNGLGSVALISLVNTFCHLHTPLLISFYRFGLGLGLGLMVTLVYFVLIKGIKKLINVMMV